MTPMPKRGVPAGLEAITGPQQALAELYALPESLIVAAAQGAPELAEQCDREREYTTWLASRDKRDKDRWLAQWMSDSQTSARRELMAAWQNDNAAPLWPTVRLG